MRCNNGGSKGAEASCVGFRSPLEETYSWFRRKFWRNILRIVALLTGRNGNDCCLMRMAIINTDNRTHIVNKLETHDWIWTNNIGDLMDNIIQGFNTGNI